jgi:hypothetical protein
VAKYGNKNKVMSARSWYYTDDESQKANSDRGKMQMQDDVMKERCVRPMIDAHKNIDHSTDEWLKRSIDRDEVRAKVKVVHQSDSFREKCRQRELSKSAEERSAIGKHRRQKQVENNGGEEAHAKKMGEINKGRISLYNPSTLEHRTMREIPEGWFRLKELTDEQRAMFPKRKVG